MEISYNLVDLIQCQLDKKDAKFQKELDQLQILATAVTTVAAVLMAMGISTKVLAFNVQIDAFQQKITDDTSLELFSTLQSNGDTLLNLGIGLLFGGLAIILVRVWRLKHDS